MWKYVKYATVGAVVGLGTYFGVKYLANRAGDLKDVLE